MEDWMSLTLGRDMTRELEFSRWALRNCLELFEDTVWVLILPIPCERTPLRVLILLHSELHRQSCLSIRNPTEQALCHSSIRLLGTLHLGQARQCDPGDTVDMLPQISIGKGNRHCSWNALVFPEASKSMFQVLGFRYSYLFLLRTIYPS